MLEGGFGLFTLAKEKGMEHNREEKREARQIRLGGGKKRPEKEHGKLYRWLDNFWYHHKWATLATLFLVIVITVCALQMCSREEKGDITVVTAGPYGFVTNEAGLLDLKNCLSTYLPEDYNGNGIKDITVYSYSIFSEDEAQELENRVDENGEPAGVEVDRYQNTQEYSNFSQYLQTGDAAVLLLSPWLAEEYSKRSGVLVDFTGLLGKEPENGVFVTLESGKTVCYGIKLCETALWRENSAVRNALPENTVICMMMPGVIGNNSDQEIYNHAIDYVKKLIEQ